MRPYIHKVNYYETDKMGLTHHSNYIRFMEEARVDFMEQLGFGYEKMEEAGVGSPVIGLECSYKKSTTFPDEIQIKVFAVKCSAFKLVIGYEMTCRDEIVLTASSTHCFLDKNGRPVILEKAFPEFYKALIDTLPKEA
ncbi:MAG: acyl-CoA thioesterase [Treponemataceae bacterium]|nr:acyl-CoA thioesterase [Treponemataceae bacterium]